MLGSAVACSLGCLAAAGRRQWQQHWRWPCLHPACASLHCTFTYPAHIYLVSGQLCLQLQLAWLQGARLENAHFGLPIRLSFTFLSSHALLSPSRTAAHTATQRLEGRRRQAACLAATRCSEAFGLHVGNPMLQKQQPKQQCPGCLGWDAAKHGAERAGAITVPGVLGRNIPDSGSGGVGFGGQTVVTDLPPGNGTYRRVYACK